MQAIERLDLCGDEVLAVKNDRGGWIVLRRACEGLEIAYPAQFDKLKDADWAVVTTIVTTGTDGKSYEMFCLHVDSFPLWLAKIEPRRCKARTRDKLTKWQREAGRVLADWAYGRNTAASSAITLEDAISRLVTVSEGINESIRLLSDGQAGIRSEVVEVREAVDSLGHRVELIESRLPRHRERISDKTKARHANMVRLRYMGACPCCHQRSVFGPDGSVAGHGEFDHAMNTGSGSLQHTWLVCRPCNQRMKDARESADRAAFEAYQRHFPRQVQPVLFR